ncbi:MAG TPA: CinA family protein [Candidatus Binatia bacterium]|nr:CinA family protein [Candidatus Binatia bacterium]
MDDPLVDRAAALQAVCLAAGLRVATAESSTGGLVAHLLTEVPGSSGYFRGGVVAYANEAKVALCGVDPALIEAHGAVSAQVARAMAVGTRSRFGVDLACAVTGIAGPEGGTPAKPVGLTYVAVADGGEAVVRRVVWTGNRHDNKRASAELALELLLERAETLAAARAAAGRDAGGAGATGSTGG